MPVSDFINHTIFGDDNIDMLVVRFDGGLWDDLNFKGKGNLAGGDGQPGNEPVIIPFSGTDPAPFFIQGHCRNNGNVNFVDRNDLAAGFIRLENIARSLMQVFFKVVDFFLLDFEIFGAVGRQVIDFIVIIGTLEDVCGLNLMCIVDIQKDYF